MLAGEVEAPVFLEVAVADDRAQGQDGFGAVQAPSAPSYQYRTLAGQRRMSPRRAEPTRWYDRLKG